MFGPKLGRGSFVVAVACLGILIDGPGTAPAQQGAAPKKTRAKRLRAKKSVAKSSPRPKGETEAKTVADRIVLRDAKELLGQVDESSSDGMLTILRGAKRYEKCFRAGLQSGRTPRKKPMQRLSDGTGNGLPAGVENARQSQPQEIGLPPGSIVSSPTPLGRLIRRP